MTARGPLLLAMAAVSTLPGCSPPVYAIDAFADDAGRIWFKARFEGYWPLKWREERIEIDQLEVVTAEGVMWAIRFDAADKRCEQLKFGPDSDPVLRYPIRYGEVRACLDTIVEAKKLPSSERIIVRAEDLNGGVGEFSLHRSVTLHPETDSPFEGRDSEDWPSTFASRQSVAPPVDQPGQ